MEFPLRLENLEEAQALAHLFAVQGEKRCAKSSN
jgi:hypothetical protein